MKTLFAALFIAAALVQATPAPASMGYEVVVGYGTDQRYVAGPFASLTDCNNFMQANSMRYPLRCDYVQT